MSTESFSDFVLEQLAALDGRLYFKTRPGTLPDSPSFHAEVFAHSEKQVLNHFRWFWSDMLKDVVQLTTWKNAKARP